MSARDRTENAVELLRRGVVLQLAQRAEGGGPLEGSEGGGVGLEGRGREERYENGREEEVHNATIYVQRAIVCAIGRVGAADARQCPEGADDDVQVDGRELVGSGGVIQVLEEGRKAGEQRITRNERNSGRVAATLHERAEVLLQRAVLVILLVIPN